MTIPNRFKRPTPYDKLNMAEIGELLEVSRTDVMRLMAKGWLRYVKIAGQRRARRADVDACKAKIEAQAGQAS